MRYSAEKVEMQRRAALDSRDAVRYFALCNEMGISEHSLEDFGLYERGQLEFGAQSGFLGDKRSDEENGELVRLIAIVAPVALRRFPELERGERIGVKEIKKRLGEIRSVGYSVKPYSDMKREEAWAYLQEIRGKVARDAREHCPDVLEFIDADNSARKREAIEHR